MNSVARKINREGIVLLGWGRAILLQVAHPLVAAAIGDFSDFDQGAVGYLRRMHRTVGAMLTLTFGTDADARAVLQRINRIHDQVEGTLREPAGIFPAGTRYSAAIRTAAVGARHPPRFADAHLRPSGPAPDLDGT